MIITAYLDESGTHGAATMTLAAVAGDARNWATYDRLVPAVFADYGVKTFHAQDWKHSQGEFKGMSPDRRAEFLDRFGEAINQSVAFGCCAVLNMAAYKTEYAQRVKAAGKQGQSAYVLGFRAVLSTVMESTLRRPDSASCTVNVVIEGGHRNVGGVEAAFTEIQGYLRPQLDGLLGSLTIGTRDQFPQLCAADSLASFGWGLEQGQVPRLSLRGASRADASYKGNFYRVEVGAEALNSLADEVPPPRRRRIKPDGVATTS